MLSKVEENFTMTSNFGCFSESVVGVHGFFSGHDFLVILLEVWPWYPTLSHYYRCSCSASKIKRHPDRENLSEDVPQIDHHPMSPCRNMCAECTRCSDNQIRFLLVTQCYTYVYIYIIIYNYYMSVYIYNNIPFDSLMYPMISVRGSASHAESRWHARHCLRADGRAGAGNHCDWELSEVGR
jgi:hypothetical protein